MAADQRPRVDAPPADARQAFMPSRVDADHVGKAVQVPELGLMPALRDEAPQVDLLRKAGLQRLRDQARGPTAAGFVELREGVGDTVGGGRPRSISLAAARMRWRLSQS